MQQLVLVIIFKIILATIFNFVFAGDTHSLVHGQQNNAHCQISNATRGKSAEVGDSVCKVPLDGVDAERCAPRCALLHASSPSGSVQPPEAAAAAGASKVFEEGSGLSWEGINEGLAIHQKGIFCFLAVVFISLFYDAESKLAGTLLLLNCLLPLSRCFGLVFCLSF